MEKPVILHIAPHLTTGVGSVLLSTLKFSKNAATSFIHEIIITDEKHLKPKSLEAFSEYSDCLHIGKSNAFIKEKLNKADIIQIEW